MHKKNYNILSVFNNIIIYYYNNHLLSTLNFEISIWSSGLYLISSAFNGSSSNSVTWLGGRNFRTNGVKSLGSCGEWKTLLINGKKISQKLVVELSKSV